MSDINPSETVRKSPVHDAACDPRVQFIALATMCSSVELRRGDPGHIMAGIAEEFGLNPEETQAALVIGRATLTESN